MLVVFVEVMFDSYDIAPQATAVLSKRDTTIRHSMNVLAQIGITAAVAIPILACVDAELIVFCKVSSDAPAVISDPGRDVLVWTSGISVAHGKIETVSWWDVSFKIGVVGRSLLLRWWWGTGSGTLARLNADNDDKQNGRRQMFESRH